MCLKQFYVLFCANKSIKPTLYKTIATINKHIQKSPGLQYKTFNNQEQAKIFVKSMGSSSRAKKLQSPTNIQKQKIQKVQQSPQMSKESDQQKFLNKSFDDKISKIKNHWICKYFTPSPLLKTDIPTTINLFFDGSSRFNPGPAAIGYIGKNNDNKSFFKKSWYIGFKTNNQAQFCALSWGLLDCAIKGIPQVNVFGDSLLIINAMSGLYRIQNHKLYQYWQLTKQIQSLFLKVRYTHIDRSLNQQADTLARTATERTIRKL